METSSRESYLVTEIMTATPQKLQLTLIEGAIRFIERTRMLWQAGRDDLACESLIRAQDIVSEILSALNHEVAPELTHKVAGIYSFIFRRLAEAGLDRNAAKLDEALRVLAIERDTWRMVCEQVPGTAASQGPLGAGGSHRIDAGNPVPPMSLPAGDSLPTAGFSIEA